MKKVREGKAPSVWKNYFSMLWKSKLPWILMAVCLLLALGRAELTVLFAKWVGKTMGGTYAQMSDAITPLWILFAIGMSIILLKVFGAHLQGILTAQVERNIQRYAVSRVFYLKMADVEKDDPREIVTRLTDDTSKSANFIIDLLVNELPRLYYIVVAIIAVIAMGLPVLTVTLLCVIPVIFIGAYISGKITFKNRNKIQQKIATLTAKLAERIDNVDIIKSYGTENQEITAGDSVILELDKVKKQGAFVDQINAFITNMMWFLPLLLIIIPPAIYLFEGTMTQADFYAYILLATSFRTYTAEHLQLWIYLKDAQGATLRLATILSSPSEKGEVAKSQPLAGDLVFDQVSFAYGKEMVLDQVSFRIPQGKKTAIVGLSGSGKSTILNLIEKFYQPTSGSITMAGTDLSSLDYAAYRSLFSYLPQNAPGFSGSVRAMLNYSSPVPYSDEQLNKVLSEVGLAEDLAPLGGLDYEVGYAAERLSGGQRQKIGVARLLLSQSDFVLLDEATSALDAKAACQLQGLVDKACEKRTEIMVAHSLSTVSNADQILVFNHGKLVGQGNHQELIKSCPFYQELVREGK